MKKVKTSTSTGWEPQKYKWGTHVYRRMCCRNGDCRWCLHVTQPGIPGGTRVFSELAWYL